MQQAQQQEYEGTDSQEPSYDAEYYTDMPIGEILRRARTHYGLTLEDVEKSLRIRASQLQILEEGTIEKLPGRVYAIGFVRSYSEFLGLDGDKMVHLFKMQSVGGHKKPALHFPVPASESKIPNLQIVIASAVGLIVIIALFAIFSGGSDKEKEIPAVPADIQAEVSEEGALISLEPEKPVVQTDLDHRIALYAEENAWVEIRSGDDVLISKVLKAGETYLVPDKANLTLDTGNIGALSLTVDNQSIPALGERGMIKRNVSLDADSLLSFENVIENAP